MPTFPLSSPSLLLLPILLYLLFQTGEAASTRTTTNTYAIGHVARASRPAILPLRAQKVASSSLPRSPSKLRFHHNVSLTVSLAVGTPPQNVSMVLDTGSELSWLLCNTTTSSSPFAFNSTTSSSYRSLPCWSPTCQSQARDLPIPPSCDIPSNKCHVSLSYADASTSDGYLAADTFLLSTSSNFTPVTALFGCMSSSYDSTSSTTNSTTAATGLLGMNRGALSFVTQTGTRKFSYCIADLDDDNAGLLLLGGDAAPPFFLPLNYTPLIQMSLPLPYFDRVAYSVQLEGIRVGATNLPIPKSVLSPDHTGAGQTMVDSGTQFTFLLGEAYVALKNEFLRQTRAFLPVLDEPDFVFQGAFDTCFRISESELSFAALRLPKVSLVLRGAEVSVGGARLLYRVAGERRGSDALWCLTFGNSDMVSISAYVIGHHHQQNLWVQYDLDNARVGFAPVSCDLASQRLAALL